DLRCIVYSEAIGLEMPAEIAPRSLETVSFLMDINRPDVEDRRSGVMDVSIGIQWRRKSCSDVNLTSLPVPRLLISIGEPRVLAHVSYSNAIPSLIELSYTLENPSSHFL